MNFAALMLEPAEEDAFSYCISESTSTEPITEESFLLTHTPVTPSVRTDVFSTKFLNRQRRHFVT